MWATLLVAPPIPWEPPPDVDLHVEDGDGPNRRPFRGEATVAVSSADVNPPREPSEPAASVRPSVDGSIDLLHLAVGLSPDAPGSKDERDLLDRLVTALEAARDPKTEVHRLRPGVGSGKQVCRDDRRHDMVMLIGYVPDQPNAVLLTHDCRLDIALGQRSIAEIDDPKLATALWHEHVGLVQSGMKERRRPVLGRGARVGLIAGAALVVVGVAVGVLLAGTLRDEKVVLTVSP